MSIQVPRESRRLRSEDLVGEKAIRIELEWQKNSGITPDKKTKT